jgi:hypothetical protein
MNDLIFARILLLVIREGTNQFATVYSEGEKYKAEVEVMIKS